jgi:hypothetical protein
MTPDQRKRIEELHQAAHAKSPDQRAAFLADVCRDDEVLRREVESLLSNSSPRDSQLFDSAAATSRC